MSRTFQTLQELGNATLAACRELGATFPAPVNPRDLPDVVRSIPRGTTIWQPPPLDFSKPIVRWVYHSAATGAERVVFTNAELGGDAAPPPDAGDWTASWGGKTWKMIFQGWSSTGPLANVLQARVDAGAMYIPEDGKTRLLISIGGAAIGANRADTLTQTVRFTATGGGTMTVDWGDGSAPTVTAATSAADWPHTYPGDGDYVVEMRRDGGSWSFSTASNTPAWGGSSATRAMSLVKIQMGQTNAAIGASAFRTCYALQSATMPQGTAAIGGNAFQNCYALQSATIPQGVANAGDYLFNNCYALRSVVMPQSLAGIGASAFQGCFALQSAVIPQGLANIGASAFATSSMVEYFLTPAAPPVLANANAFNNNPASTRWYVPDASLAAYQSANIWSTFAPRIIPFSQLAL